MSFDKQVAVIGAGISGILAAAHMRNEGLNVTVFERASMPGGIWCYDEQKPLEPAYNTVPVSQATKTYSELNIDSLESAKLLHAPPGPCYSGLKNNVSIPLLQTTLNHFPEGTPDFVSHGILKDYIQETAAKTKVHELTQYNTSVKGVTKRDGKWSINTTTLEISAQGDISRDNRTSNFDAVVVASGNYHAAKVPRISGLSEWKSRWPQRIQHSKSYRTPEGFQGKNILLIGGAVSSTDIARELGAVARNVYQSSRGGDFDLTASLLPENAVRVEEVVAFDVPPTSSGLSSTDPIPATATLKSGRKLCDIHHIILCTGYHLTLPFLPQLHADDMPVSEADDTVLVTDGTQFHNLHKDIFYIKDPSLVFVGVPFFTATFTLFEFQAIAAAKALSGEAKLPSEQAMRAEYDAKVKAKGNGKMFHSLKDIEEKYVDELLEWLNNDAEEKQRKRIEGYTEQWKVARVAQAQRVRTAYAKDGAQRQLEISCYG